MSLTKSFNRMCRKHANPMFCCLALTVIVGTLAYFVLTNLYREGFKGAKEFVLYHMKGCPHCVKMMPEWAKFVSGNKSGIKTRKVEQSQAQDEIKKHGISGFPSLLLLDGNGDKIKAYQGARTANAFASFCSQNA